MTAKNTWSVCLMSLIVLASLCLPPSTCQAEETPLPVLNTKPRTVAIFKNGLGFFIRQGDVSPDEGWAITEHVPPSSLGSFWITPLDQGSILEEAIGLVEEGEQQTQAASIAELIKINVGREATLTYGDKAIHGTIKLVAEDRQPEQEQLAMYGSGGSYIPPYLQPQVASLVIISTEEGELALNKNSISSIQFSEPISTTFTTYQKHKRIKFRMETEQDPASLGLAYLQKNITWVPSYLLNIDDPDKATITMKATVANDAEDLQDVDLIFVVGYPNFMFADILSPMALDESIAEFMAALQAGSGRPDEYSRLANIMSQRVTFAAEGADAIPPLDYGYTAIQGLPGESEEDLFLYQKESVSLNKGERAYYHVFFDEVDYQHIYEWEVPDTLRLDAYGYQRSQSQEQQLPQVWHSVKLTNSTQYPWTTAPAFVVSGWKPLAQGTIDYTPRGADTNLKLTVATDIKTDMHEEELDRKREVRVYRRSYDLVTVKGDLRVANHKTEQVAMEVKKYLTGEVREASHDGEVQKAIQGLSGVNPRSTISWEVDVEPGEELTLTYQYQVYVAN